MKQSIKIKGYKCFDEEYGFDDIKRANIIIGKNNSGKSTLLDLIQAVSTEHFNFEESKISKNKPQVLLESYINENDVNIFSKSISGGEIGGNHYSYGKNLVGRKIKWSIKKDQVKELLFVEEDDISPEFSTLSNYHQNLLNRKTSCLYGKTYVHLSAERDIIPEGDNSKLNYHSNGSGATNIIQSFINKSKYNSNLVEINLLEGLNTIFSHDLKFNRILSQLHDNDTWEIFLEEDEKGIIPLSKSGSGIKTVILVLITIIILPKLNKQSLSNYIFAYEELENNLHPLLLRRLLNYIYQKSIEENFYFFLTTHSNIVIDLFSKNSNSQITHVIQKDKKSYCKTVQTYIQKNGILDDLDIRASDILQSNGIIWVEGPSDRIYINKWIEIISKGEITEGSHYSCMFYGGRLLYYLDSEDPEVNTQTISLLNINRNAMIIIDSDKKTSRSPVNKTKKRIKEEMEKLNSVCWITKGKELENYIHPQLISKLLITGKIIELQPYNSFFEDLNSFSSGKGKYYLTKKPLLASSICQHIDSEDDLDILDLKDKIIKVVHEIRKWNEIK